MASVRQAVKVRLDAHAGLSALVGNRNYFSRGPQKPTFPFTVFLQVGSVPHRAMGRDLSNQSPRVQVSVYARTPEEMETAALQVRAAMQDWTGEAAGLSVSRCLLENEVDLGFDLDGQAHGVALDFTVHLA